MSAAVLLTAAGTSGAQVIQTSSGLAVSPAIEQLSLPDGQSSLTFNIDVINDAAQPVTVAAFTDDFTALNATGSTLFLNNTAKIASPHGLAHWMTPSITEFDISEHDTKQIAVTITKTDSMAPGGHYGSVIFKVLPTASGGVANRLGANAEVSTLVFLTVGGHGAETVSLAKPHVGTVNITLPSAVDLLLANTGDVQTVPRGLVTVTDTWRREAQRGTINVESGIVLPDTSRLYQVQLRTEQRLLWPGWYTVRVAYRADGAKAFRTYTTGFVYVSPLLALVSGLVILTLSVFGIRYFGRKVIHYRA